MKRIFCIGLVLLLVLAAGCTPRPAPSNTASPLPDLTPGVSPGISPSALPNDAGGTGTGGNTGGTAGTTIPNFAEGTVVQESDVPDIKAALQEKFPGSTITSIKHGMQGTQQAYVVEYTTAEGAASTAYILPNGMFAPEGAAASPGTTNAGTATPGTTNGAAASPGATKKP